MFRGVRIETIGTADVLKTVDLPEPDIAPDEVLLRQTVVGVNFTDIRTRREGIFLGRQAPLPMGIGIEAVGVVERAGSATGFSPGDRAGYVGMGRSFRFPGSYAERRAVPADWLIRLPDFLDDISAAAILAKGLTAACLVQAAVTVKAGDRVMVQGAAGGTGLLLCKWTSLLGATVAGTVSSAQKAEMALANGCAHPIIYTEVDPVASLRALFPEGVDIVFDGVGKATLDASLDMLRPFGTLVSYGYASGRIEPFDLERLIAKGSLKLSKPGLRHFLANPELRAQGAATLFEFLREGSLVPQVTALKGMDSFVEAHRLVESGKVPGSIVVDLR